MKDKHGHVVISAVCLNGEIQNISHNEEVAFTRLRISSTQKWLKTEEDRVFPKTILGHKVSISYKALDIMKHF